MLRAYGVERLEFGREYIIPKPFDPRVLIWEASAVAQAAMDTRRRAAAGGHRASTARNSERRLGKAHEVMRVMINKAQKQPKRVVFPEGEEGKILRACQILLDEKIANPILLGNEQKIRAKIADLHLHLDGVQIVDPGSSRASRIHRGVLPACGSARASPAPRPRRRIRNPTTFGSMMVRLGDADALIGGLTTHYPGHHPARRCR